MQVQQAGIEVAGHNMANVNNPAYARQRVSIQTSSPIHTEHGWEGTGADVARITQIRDVLLDYQIANEAAFTGSLEAQQQALQYAQADLGQQIDRGASGAEGTAAAAGTGKQHGIGDSISALFNQFQSLSLQPSSETERDLVLTKATELADRFQQTDKRLDDLRKSLNSSVSTDVDQVNGILADLAKLNRQIGDAEAMGDSTANDIRDTRQGKLEELAKLVKFDAVEGNSGAVNITIGGVPVIEGTSVTEKLEAYDAGGKTMVRGAASGTPLDITGGRLNGTIEARDGAVQTLRDDLSKLATSLIGEVNRVHRNGFGKDGTTGLDFFQGTSAADMRVNQTLLDDPTKLQASDAPGAAGNNKIAMALGQLQNAPITALGTQTFAQKYSQVVAGVGNALSSVNEQITDQGVVSNMLQQQRDSVSAVSLDEEMTDLVKFQKAYQASARLVNVINEMLDTVVNMIH